MLISKTFNLKITSGYLYTLELGTTLAEDVNIADNAQYEKESERIAAAARAGTRKDAAVMLPALRALAAQPTPATDPKAAEATQNLKTLVARIEALGIK